MGDRRAKKIVGRRGAPVKNKKMGLGGRVVL
jgi:hypothetical protein